VSHGRRLNLYESKSVPWEMSLLDMTVHNMEAVGYDQEEAVMGRAGVRGLSHLERVT